MNSTPVTGCSRRLFPLVGRGAPSLGPARRSIARPPRPRDARRRTVAGGRRAVDRARVPLASTAASRSTVPARRAAVLRVGAGDAGRRDADVGGVVRRPRARSRTPAAICRGDVGMHGARAREQPASTPSSECLTRCRVGDDSAADDDRRRPARSMSAAASSPPVSDSAIAIVRPRGEECTSAAAADSPARQTRRRRGHRVGHPLASAPAGRAASRTASRT